MRGAALRHLVAAGSAVALVACADDFVADPDSGIQARVEAIDWPTQPVLLGETFTLRVRVEEEGSGLQVQPDSIEWIVLPGFAAEVRHAAGDSVVLRAVGLVELRITARLRHEAFDTASVSDTLAVHLNGVAVDAPPLGTFASLGESVTVKAHGFDAEGEPVSVDGWSWSVQGTAASISTTSADSVRATAAANGRAWIVATHPLCSGECRDSVPIDVAQVVTQLTVAPATALLTWIGDTAHLLATPRDARGNPAPGTITWTTSAAGTAAVNGSGVVSAIANGSASIVAQLGALADTAQVTVAQAVASIEVSSGGEPLSADTLALGDTLQLSAVARDSGGTVVPGVAVAWSSTDSTIAGVDATGRVVALGRGLATVRASAGDRSASVDVRVAVWALGFDGNDYVEVLNATTLRPDDEFTIEAWVRPRAASARAALIAIWNGENLGSAYGLYLEGLVPTVYVREDAGNQVGSLAAPTVVSMNAWHHVAFSFDNGHGELYVDGTLVATTDTLPADVNQVTAPLRFGADARAAASFLQGDLDELRVWGNARTGAEIVATMGTRLSPLDHPTLLGYWPLSEGAGNVISLVGGLIGVLGGTSGPGAMPAWILDGSPVP